MYCGWIRNITEVSSTIIMTHVPSYRQITSATQGACGAPPHAGHSAGAVLFHRLRGHRLHLSAPLLFDYRRERSPGLANLKAVVCQPILVGFIVGSLVLDVLRVGVTWEARIPNSLYTRLRVWCFGG